MIYKPWIEVKRLSMLFTVKNKLTVYPENIDPPTVETTKLLTLSTCQLRCYLPDVFVIRLSHT